MPITKPFPSIGESPWGTKITEWADDVEQNFEDLPATFAAGVSGDVSGAERLRRLRPFHAAVSNRRNAPCNILTIGHSFPEGVRADAYDQTLVSLLLERLRDMLPTPGAPGGFGSKGPGSGASWPGTDALTIFGGAGNDGGTAGFGRRAYRVDAAGEYVVWNRGSIPSTGFDIVHSKGSARGVGYYKIDGGAKVTFNTFGATSYGNVIPIRGLSDAPHTLEVGWESTNPVVFEIVDYRGDETKGIRGFNGGRGGVKTDYFLEAGGQWAANLTPYPPALVVITLMCNDFGGGYTPNTPAQVKTNLAALIAKIRAASNINPSFVICTEYERAGATDAIAPWSQYVAAAREVAAEDVGLGGASGVLTYDMAARFGAGPFSGGNGMPLVDTDNTHPDGAGYQLWADSLARFVAPQ